MEQDSTARRLEPTGERMVHLDVLRGFALLGILIVNFQWFTRPVQTLVMGSEPGLQGLDLVIDWLIIALAEGKFYALFSMLFGAGFALMLGRAEQRQVKFWGIYLRRLLVLGLFGLAHLLLVWSGDILLIYSLCGFIMVLLFRRTPLQRLWKWAIVFWSIPALLALALSGLLLLASADPELEQAIRGGFEAELQNVEAAVARAEVINREGRWVDNVGQRARDAGFLLGSAIFWVSPVLGFFLLGRWLVQSDRLAHPDQHRLFFRRWRSRGLLFGLPLAAVATALLYGQNLIVPTLPMALGGVLMTLASIFLSLAWLSMVTLGARRLAWLAPAGRMALSNYLMQSLAWTWLFYGHGAGLWGLFPRWSHLLLALGFFAVQVAFSHWWMQRYRFGPAEWLWRSLSYLSLQPLRRGSADSP
ncbi:MAG: DUF418 domain-containing protein [Wenzhouxiangella sp.]